MSAGVLKTIDRLLEHARPGGIPHRRLIKYRDHLMNNVILGPGILKYIRELADKADDISVECRHLTGLGKCRKLKRLCKHPDDNRVCDRYEKAHPQTRGNPLEGLNR